MARDTARADQLKAEGNKHFQAGNWVVAESFYSKAIIADDTNPALYTNRAMARLKLQYYDEAIADCHSCLRLNKTSMKAYHILSQAHQALRNYDDALDNALKAHAICAETNDKSLSPVTAQVLTCKKERWDHLEKRRVREAQELENETVELMERERDSMLAACSAEDQIERKQIEEEWEGKISRLRETFERARPDSEKLREVPDWAIDDISFGIMVDPVVTKTGKSYERASLMEHLRKHPSDPLTREPLSPNELRPNLGLRQACEEFLAQNGWAVDW
ncbi:U-box domain-containing protein [Microdochium bolleyi]|uniref:U-box domain-containing protein n=1 Tax=Microdochium bolleyi TaxID=196109 RepID=A0A136ITQ4_9PEZI|nr:U-box domain-containing protein [Microdochium bolleyi]